ncbi:MAG: sucrose phosphorylase [Anaerolineales bacterium]|nr:sucrose phosphorylase [Anaerolineales bacterium]
MPPKNKVQLITYPDSMGGGIRSLGAVLEEFFPRLFEGGIHLLPPFPSSGDRGFAPLTYAEIDPRFGAWDDIRRLGQSYDILLDLMVNHISRKSPYFRDFQAKGPASEWADLFIPLAKFWPDGEPRPEDLKKIFLRRKRPYSTFAIGPGRTPTRLWTTFGHADPSEQVDMDWRSPAFKKLIAEYLRIFAANGVKIVRLDAIGYLVKKPGTDCFFVEPEIFQFLEWIQGAASSLGIDVLPEVHARKEIQHRLAEKGYWIYDFILPYLVLNALFTSSAGLLAHYLARRPARQFTMLDCHDGIPVKPDLEGFYDSAGARAVAAVCERRGGNFSRIESQAHKDPDGFDVHQIRGTYYSLLGRDDEAYLIARAIQFFAPGIPQVYYVGLLAGENDLAAAQRTGDGREINRHVFSVEEIGRQVRSPVVKGLCRLIRFRNSHPAFQGEFNIPAASGDSALRLRWSAGRDWAEMEADLKERSLRIAYSEGGGSAMLDSETLLNP